MEYLGSIGWLLTWPIGIYISYKLIERNVREI